MFGQERCGESCEDRHPILEPDVDGHRSDVLSQDEPDLAYGRAMIAARCEEDRRAHRGMACEWDFDARGEDPDPCNRVGRFGRAKEDRLRKVHLSGDSLHQIRGEMCCVRENAQRISAEGLICEDVERMEAELHALCPLRS